MTTFGAVGAACTVDHPTANTNVNQNTTGGDGGGDTTIIVECKDNCEKTRVTCVAACSDDACKATCTVDRDKCDTDCK
jgi:hypothetical protein